MKIAVVILNWNGKALLEQFLPSVVAYSKEATVYLADNASSDDSISFTSEMFPTVKIVRNNKNLGYASGYNAALESIEEDLLVLLNNDVEVSEGWLKPMIEAFNHNSKLAAAQPKILDYKQRDRFEYAGASGGFLDRYGYPFCRGRLFDTLELDEGQYNDQAEIFWASGACLFVRKTSFWKAGGFDPDFFAHQEEIDLCWRIRKSGQQIDVVPKSVVYHMGGGTLSSNNPRKTFLNFRNTLLLLVKNRSGLSTWWIIFQRLLLDAVAGLLFLTQGKFAHFTAIIKAHLSFYGLLPKFLKKRKTEASSLKYFKIKSVVWNYFILKNRNFNKL